MKVSRRKRSMTGTNSRINIASPFSQTSLWDGIPVFFTIGQAVFIGGGTNIPIVTINSWNEWTEGSYIEPDTINGMGYLEAIRTVFKPE
ncbi:glycoside hydrolase family 99-like domain-containing protein [Paenibacillus agaridevorans]|uniref:glycoside hydrolase family 99-like domain-containing protein n=1 Tax=Paenibacillus agaridevorans TaxID=171404 RepID=UPI001BE44479|nr:glycoside hydrolase family 99-like domain-containing protein [Paenibacillus agaridevorans]